VNPLSSAVSIYKYFYAKVKRKVKYSANSEICLWIMGRRPTTPEGAKAVSAKLPLSLHIGIQQLILDRWRKSGRKVTQNQVLIEALEEYLKNSGVKISQIEEDVGKWEPKEERTSKITKFSNKRRSR
jgi:hypothetical protein